MSILLGSSTARITVIEAGGRSYTTDFPLTNLASRQMETVDPEGYEHKETNLAILPSQITKRMRQVVTGFWISWTLGYNDFIDPDDAVNFGQLINSMRTTGSGNARFFFTPRIDMLWRQFEVYVPLQSFSMGVSTGGVNANLNKDFQITLRTLNMVTDIQWAIRPDPAETIYSCFTGGYKWVLQQ